MMTSFSAVSADDLDGGRSEADDAATVVEAGLTAATSLTGMMSSSSMATPAVVVVVVAVIIFLVVVVVVMVVLPFRPLVSLTGCKLKFCRPRAELCVLLLRISESV